MEGSTGILFGPFTPIFLKECLESLRVALRCLKSELYPIERVVFWIDVLNLTAVDLGYLFTVKNLVVVFLLNYKKKSSKSLLLMYLTERIYKLVNAIATSKKHALLFIFQV